MADVRGNRSTRGRRCAWLPGQVRRSSSLRTVIYHRTSIAAIHIEVSNGPINLEANFSLFLQAIEYHFPENKHRLPFQEICACFVLIRPDPNSKTRRTPHRLTTSRRKFSDPLGSAKPESSTVDEISLSTSVAILKASVFNINNYRGNGGNFKSFRNCNDTSVKLIAFACFPFTDKASSMVRNIPSLRMFSWSLPLSIQSSLETTIGIS